MLLPGYYKRAAEFESASLAWKAKVLTTVRRSHDKDYIRLNQVQAIAYILSFARTSQIQ